MATTRMRFMQSCIRSNGRIFARTFLFRHPSARREYTTSKSKTSKVFEEALWAAGSVAVTIPSCWFLLSGREGHLSHHENHNDSQHSSDSSDDSTEENNSEESEELPEELTVESTLKNEVVSHESDEKQKDIHESNRSNTTSECTSCEVNTGDIDHGTSNSELAGDQYERQDDISSSDDSKPVESLR